MRKHKQIFKRITLTALLITGFTAGSIAQDITTIVEPEKEAPVILSTTPTAGEDNVDTRTVFKITFSSEMDETTITGTTLLLHASSADVMHDLNGNDSDDQIEGRSAMIDTGNSWQHTAGAVNGTVSYSDKVAVFTPEEELKEDAMYTFTVTNGVKNLENIALENDHSWSFTTTGTSDSSYSDNRHRESGMDRNKYSEGTTDTTQNGKTNMIVLGKASQFVILAKTDINNESGSRITGQTGEGSVTEKMKKENDFTEAARERISGQVLVLESNQNDTTSPDVNEAIDDMMSAYGAVSSQNGDDLTSHQNDSFHDTVMTSGIHEWSESLHIVSDVTLSGSTDDVWLFKVCDDLIIEENIVFTLSDGAQADNIFWYVEGEVTIGKNAHFEGIILSMNEITLEEGANLNGRLYSQKSITLDDNTVTQPGTATGYTTPVNR